MEFMEMAENTRGHMDFTGCAQYADTIFFGVAIICSLFSSPLILVLHLASQSHSGETFFKHHYYTNW